jgi:hypothetical protein
MLDESLMAGARYLAARVRGIPWAESWWAYFRHEAASRLDCVCFPRVRLPRSPDD